MISLLLLGRFFLLLGFLGLGFGRHDEDDELERWSFETGVFDFVTGNFGKQEQKPTNPKGE